MLICSKKREAASDVLQLPKKEEDTPERPPKKIMTIVVVWILHLVPRLHLEVTKLYLT